MLPTRIGFPSPDFTDKHAAHGNPFVAEHISRTKQVLGIPDEPFWAGDGLVAEYRDRSGQRCADAYARWQQSPAPVRLSEFASTEAANRAEATLPSFGPDETPATRVAIQKVLAATSDAVPNLVAGAADLTGNTGAKLNPDSPFSRSDRSNRQIYFGIREHAMGAVANGLALHGHLVPVVGTFFVFADYMRPAIRLAALSGAKVIFVFSHDSVGVGEDGPTHQPVEHLASLRVIPGLQVVRPADAVETAAAFVDALRHEGPTALILSRQNLPIVTDGSAVGCGAGVVGETAAHCDISIVATGSEVALAVAAARKLAEQNVIARVVSAPNVEKFLSQSESTRESIVPSRVPVLSVEAGSTFGWQRVADASVGIDSFGTSAPGAVALEHLGINVEAVVAAARHLLGK